MSGERSDVRAAQAGAIPPEGAERGTPTRFGPTGSERAAGGLPGVTETRTPAAAGRPRRGGATEGAPADTAGPRTYYGGAVLKPPVWSAEIPVYFLLGGLAGASAPLAFAAELRGNARLARSAWLAALAALSASPPLLISDLGRPERFVNMLRVVKPTSPMSVGSWVLSATGGGVALASARSVFGWFPRAGVAGGALAAALGPVLSTYTAVLIADTAVPAWHEARRELPFTFAGSSAAAAGAVAAITTPTGQAGPARRLLLLGASLELVSSQLIERGLGEAGEPYRRGDGGRFLSLSKALTAAGAATVARAGRRRRSAAVAGGALVLAGALAARWGIYRAGFASAADPKYVVTPQRERAAGRVS